MEKGKLNVLGVFQGRDFDLSEMSRAYDIYTQNTKNTADTIKNNRIDIYIPWKPVFLDGLDCLDEITAVTTAGDALAANGAGEKYCALSSACDQIETLQFLHGNGSGEVIYEISGSAYAYLQAMYQDSKDPSKYGLYVKTEGPKNRDAVAEDFKQISDDRDFLGSCTLEQSLLSKIQLERFEKFRRMNMLAADDPSAPQATQSGYYCSYSFEDDPSWPIKIIPLIMFPKGITIRRLLRTDSWNCVPKKALMTNDVYAGAKVVTSVESRFKFDNSRIITSEIILSSDLQKQFYDEIE